MGAQLSHRAGFKLIATVGNESVKGNKRANCRKNGEHAIERHARRKRQNSIFRKAVPNPFENVLRNRLLWRRRARSCDHYYFDLSVAGEALEAAQYNAYPPSVGGGRGEREMHRVQARALDGDMIRKKSFNLCESYMQVRLELSVHKTAALGCCSATSNAA